MVKLKRILRYMAILIVVAMSVGCSSALQPATRTPTEFPPTMTPALPTSTAEPTSPPTEQPFTEVITDFEITFTGEDCFVTGPEEITAGDYSFKFIDYSGKRAFLWVQYDDEDKTYQDYLSRQSQPGEYFPKPAWVRYDTQVEKESRRFDDYRIDIETWRLDSEAMHVILCFIDSPNKELWFGAPIYVTGSVSD